MGSGRARDSDRLGKVAKGCVKVLLNHMMLSTAIEAIPLFFLGCVLNGIAHISWDGIVVKDNYNDRMNNC